MTEAILYENPAFYDALVPPGPCARFYGALAAAARGPVLELACGTGRLANALALADHDVTGIDLAEPMLRAARAKARSLAVSARYVRADMRSFALGRRFALVILSCNSLGHMHEDADVTAVFARVRAHLAPGGRFAFDVRNAMADDVSPQPRRGVWSEAGGSAATAERLVAYDPARQLTLMQWRMRGDDGRQTVSAPMALRLFRPDHLEASLAGAELTVTDRFGDFDGRPLERDSLNQVRVARATR